MSQSHKHKLPLRIALGFGVGDIASSLAVTTNSLFLLKFATDALHLNGYMAGLALLIGKIFDAITDPLMGEIVDRTKHRWGSKRPYILFGAVPFGLSFFALYALPQVSSSTTQFILFTACCSLQSLCFTICNIPYTTLTASLTQDAGERGRLTTFRFVFATTAGIFAAVATLGLAKSLGYAWVGGIYGALMTAALLVTFFSTEEQPNLLTPPPFSLKESLSSYLRTWQNRPFRLLLGVFFFHAIGFGLMASWVVYYAKYSLLMKNEELVMAPMIMTALLMLVPWYLISTKIDKKRSYLIGALISIPGLLLMLWPAPNATIPILTVSIILGIGYSSHILFPYAMVPDVIEFDEWDHGVRREGMFYGVWVFSEKLARGCSFMLAGWGLTLIGYTKGTPLPPDIGHSIRWMIALAPIIFVLIGTLLLALYPLTSEKHREICQQLQERRDKEAAEKTPTPG